MVKMQTGSYRLPMLKTTKTLNHKVTLLRKIGTGGRFKKSACVMKYEFTGIVL